MVKIMINSWKNKNLNNLQNKTIVITGTTSGLGFEALKHLVSMGANIIVGVRNTQKAENQAKEIQQLNPASKITILKLDLSDLGSIYEFAENVKSLYTEGVFALINNAGIFAQPKSVLNYGYEKHFFTNTLAPIILSKKLLPVLEKQQNSKIVFVSSISFNKVKINFDDIDLKNDTKNINTYANTKRWLTFYALELAKVLKAKNSNVSVAICHPGITGTALMNPKNGTFSKITYRFCDIGQKILFPSPKKASLTELASINAKTNDFEWISPSIFNIWGYPKKTKLKIRHFNPNEITDCYNKIEEILSKITNVKN